MGTLRVVSGGQTGVDRSALDAAEELGLPTGGWCPRGRRAEDGPIPDRYTLRETPETAYAQRTEWNVRDSDGTLVLTIGPPDGGTALTLELARRQGRPTLCLDLAEDPRPVELRAWLDEHDIAVLNVAGPREGKRPGIGGRARSWLVAALRAATSSPE